MSEVCSELWDAMCGVVDHGLSVCVSECVSE